MKIYGIDLGTTNSILGYGNELLTGLVPSVVNLDTGKTGASEKDNPNAIRSFKMDISTGKEGERSLVASAHVLNKLREEAGLEGRIKAVITVPADFNDAQRRATMKAAEMVNIEVASLINEPTAASLYITQGRKTVAIVFDLGGGTFDVSVIDSRFGNYDVQYSEGDTHCGGDDLDKLIMKYIMKEAKIMLFRLSKEQQFRLQQLSTSIKIRMQKERHNFVVDLSEYGAGQLLFTEESYIRLMKLAFMKCITILRHVIDNSIGYGTPFELVMVGGSTRCPYLREWVEHEIGTKCVDMDYDPDLAVAHGAALYASLYESGEADIFVSDVTKALSIGLYDGTVRNIIPQNSKVPIEEDVMLTNPTEVDKLILSLYQGDSGFIQNQDYIGTLTYDYGRMVAPRAGNVIVTVLVESSGRVKLTCKEIGKAPVSVELSIT